MTNRDIMILIIPVIGRNLHDNGTCKLLYKKNICISIKLVLNQTRTNLSP